MEKLKSSSACHRTWRTATKNHCYSRTRRRSRLKRASAKNANRLSLSLRQSTPNLKLPLFPFAGGGTSWERERNLNGKKGLGKERKDRRIFCTKAFRELFMTFSCLFFSLSPLSSEREKKRLLLFAKESRWKKKTFHACLPPAALTASVRPPPN